MKLRIYEVPQESLKEFHVTKTKYRYQSWPSSEYRLRNLELQGEGTSDEEEEQEQESDDEGFEDTDILDDDEDDYQAIDASKLQIVKSVEITKRSDAELEQ